MFLNLTNLCSLITHKGLKASFQLFRALNHNVVDLIDPHLRCELIKREVMCQREVREILHPLIGFSLSI